MHFCMLNNTNTRLQNKVFGTISVFLFFMQIIIKNKVLLGVKWDPMEVNWDSNRGEVGQSKRIGTKLLKILKSPFFSGSCLKISDRTFKASISFPKNL